MRFHLVSVLHVLLINGPLVQVRYNARNVLAVIIITLVPITVVLALLVLTLMKEDPVPHVLIILFLMVLLVNVFLALQEQKEMLITKLVTFVQETNIQTVQLTVFLAPLVHTP